MTRILVAGALGMLGHKLFQVCSQQKEFETFGTIHDGTKDIYKYGNLFHKKQDIKDHVDAKIILSVEKAIQEVKPDVVVNCIGIVKSLTEKKENKLDSIWVNSLFPHQLYQICDQRNIKLIHISTDCVFRGKFGNYKELHNPDATDLYGRTKYLGEVNGRALTIRTSIIGRELSYYKNLVEWFLGHDKGQPIQGYVNALWNGFTTLELSNIIVDIIKNHSDLSGLYHLSSETVNKYSLLKMIKDAMKLDLDLVPYPDFVVDRTLNSELFREITGFKPKPMIKQIEEFAEDAKMYSEWR